MMKRVLDFTASLAGLIFLAPLLLIVALLIKLQSQGPVFFVQRRIGQGGRPFRMYKFRSMNVSAPRQGPALTIGQDPRITKVGAVLRKTKLDELPQLLNVIRGEMSLVGPRPEVENYVQLYSETQRQVLRLKPGLTDPASFALFDESDVLAKVADPERFYVHELMPEKIRINLAYAETATVATDLLLIVATVLRTVGVQFDVFGRLQLEAPKLKVKV